MFDREQLEDLRQQVRTQAAKGAPLLDQLLAQAQEMADDVRTIRPRQGASVALMATDGGNNTVSFNPFELRIIRVVDSAGQQLLLDVVSPAADISEVGRRHLDHGHARTPLGRLMADLGVDDLRHLSPMLSGRSGRWVETYRDLCEWAMLYDLVCRRDFATDTLIVRDGLLRDKIFASDLLMQMGQRMRAAIGRTAREERRRVWLVGLAKRSAVLDQFRLAMSLAGIFDRGSPCFVKVPAAMQESVYRWDEYLRGLDLVLPYRDDFQSIPMHGQFVLIQLEHEDEAVLGRITSIAAEGRLVSPIGEDYAIRAVRDERPIPDELRDQYLKYRVDIRVLGVERLDGDKLIFVPSHRWPWWSCCTARKDGDGGPRPGHIPAGPAPRRRGSS